jgi:hypothetical protein
MSIAKGKKMCYNIDTKEVQSDVQVKKDRTGYQKTPTEIENKTVATNGDRDCGFGS